MQQSDKLTEEALAILSEKKEKNEAAWKKLTDPKYMMNIKLDRDYKVYARVGYKLLRENKGCVVTFSSCGKSIINQLKIVSSLEEAIPGLHIVTNIRFTECKTCLNREKKIGNVLDEFRSKNQERVKSYVDNIKLVGPEGSMQNVNQGPISHSCKNVKSFPRLLLFQHRLSLDLEVLKVLPEFFVGYKKPQPPLPIEKTFEMILAEYDREDQVESMRNPHLSKAADLSSSSDGSSLPSWLKTDINPEKQEIAGGYSVKKVGHTFHDKSPTMICSDEAKVCHYHHCQQRYGKCTYLCEQKRSFYIHKDWCFKKSSQQIKVHHPPAMMNVHHHQPHQPLTYYIECQCGCGQLVPAASHPPQPFIQPAPHAFTMPYNQPKVKKLIDYGAQYDFPSATPTKTVTHYYNR